MKKLLAAALALSTFGAAASATAAQVSMAKLTDVKGPVFVDSGKGFVPVSGPVALKTGDRVMATGEGSAVVAFGRNCNLPVSAPEITVVEESGCVVATQGANNRWKQALIVGAGFSVPAFAFGYSIANDDDDNEVPESP